MANGQGMGVGFFSGGKLISNDITGLTKFNEALKNGVPIGQAWRENMASCTVAAKQQVVACRQNGQSLDEFIVSQEAATASSIGLTAASIALNAALTMGIAFAIQGVITGINYLIHRNEKLIESAKEVTDTYREQSKTLKDNVKSLENQKDEFNKLSKGVDDYGNNISLSADEYSRYKDIVAEILGYSPELIAGYDEEGNAIAKKNGLIEQSIALMKEEQKQKLKEITSDGNTKTVYKGAKSRYSEQRTDTLRQVRDVASGTTARIVTQNGQKITSSSGDQLESILSAFTGNEKAHGENWVDYLKKNKALINKNYDEIYHLLTEDYEFIANEGSAYEKQTWRYLGLDEAAAQNIINWLKDTYDSISDLEKLSHGMDDQFNLFAQMSDDYDELTDAQKNFVTEYIKATGEIVDADGNFLSNDEIQKKARGYTKFVDELVNNPKFDEAREQINELFSLGKLEDAESAADFEEQVNNLLDELVKKFDDFDEDDAKKIKIGLGFEFTPDGSTKVDTLIKDVEDKVRDEFDDKVGTLSLRYLEIAANIDILDNETLAWDELLERIEEYKKAHPEAIKITGALNDEIDKLQSAYSTMTDAIAEYNKEGYISVDTYQSLLDLGSEYLQYLFDEEGNLNMDAEAMQNLTIARIQDLAVQQKQKLLDLASTWKDEAAAQEYLAGAINDTTLAYENQIDAQLRALQTKWMQEWGPDNTTADQAVDYLQSQFDGIDKLTSATIKGIQSGFGMPGKSAKDTADKTKDINKQLDDLAKSEALDKLKYKFDQIEQSIEKVNTTISLLGNTLDLLAEDDYKGKIETTTRQLDLAKQKTALLTDEFAQLRAEEYNSADSANELASRMKSVADSIAENQKAILEYAKNITEYYTSALKSIGSLSKGTLDEATNLIDRNIKSLSEGGLIGLSFDLSPTVPQSAVEAQRRQNQTMEEQMRAYYDDVAAMQKAAFDLEYKEQMADNARKRQELYESLAEQKGLISDYSKDKQDTQKATNKATLDEQKKNDKEKETETKRFADAEQKIITDLNDWMKAHPIEAPALDTSKWEGLVKDAKSYAQRIQDAFSGASVLPTSTSSDDRQRLLDIARSQLGVKEGANNYNKFSKFGVEHGWAKSDSQAWCNDFVSYVATVAGLADRIPIGSYTPDTADNFGKNFHLASSGYQPQPGDVVYFKGNSPAGKYGVGHIGWVESVNPDGSINTIEGNTSNGKVERKYNRKDAVGYGTFAKGTQDYGIAGENHKLEWAINKKTGEWSPIDSPTLFDKREYEIVGEKVSEKIDKPIKAYATGTPITDPNVLAMVKQASQETGVPANIILSVIDQESGNQWIGKQWDVNGYSYGYMQLHDGDGELTDMINKGGAQAELARKAMTDPYTNILVGAQVYKRLYDKYGNWADVASAYNQGEGGLAKNGRNAYGNQVWERAKSSEFVKVAEQLGSMSSDLSGIASDVSTIAKADVVTRIKDVINGASLTVSTYNPAFEDGLVDYISQNMSVAEDTTNRLITAFESIATVDADYREKISGMVQDLKDSAGTDNYGEVRTLLSNSAQEYADAIMQETVKYQTVAAKEAFDRAKEAQQLAKDYYNNKKAEGASADELAFITNTISELNQTVQEYSDAYTSVMSSYGDYLVGNADREMRAYDDRISWLDKENEALEHSADRAKSSAEKMEIWDNLLDGYVNKQEVLNEKMDTAHQKAEDLRHNADFADIFETFDTFAWFDANGDATAQFEADRTALSTSNPELVPLMNIVFNLLQEYTKEWQSANDEAKQNAELIEDLKIEEATEKVNLYSDTLARINDIETIRLNKQQALIAATEKQNSMAQSLRKTMSDITAELDANKHLKEWLDEDTRRLLFNDEDFAEQQEAIRDIQKQADKLYKDYQSNLAKLDETEYFKQEELTAEYERQMDILNEQLEVSQKKLDVAKKQLEYENAAKERDTRIILGGRAVQVADPDKLYNLAKERANLEADYNNTLITNRENETVRDQERIAGAINEEISAREKMIELIGDMTDAEKALWAGSLPTISELSTIFNNLDPTDFRWLNEHSRDFRQSYMDMDDMERNVGYNLTVDYAGQHNGTIDPLLRAGIIPLEFANILHKDSGDRHNDKNASDMNTMQYQQTYSYGERTYKKQNLQNDEAVLEAKLREFSNGRYTPIRDNDLIFGKSAIEFVKGIMVKPVLSLSKEIADTVGQTIANVQNAITNQNDSSTHIQNTVMGDIVVTETIDNVDDVFCSVTNQLSSRWDITKNMRRT